jgi:hypothetical protein
MVNKLESTIITADDLVTILMILTIEIVGALLPSKQAELTLTDIANRLEEFSRKTTNERAALLAGSLAANLMGTEEAP